MKSFLEIILLFIALIGATVLIEGFIAQMNLEFFAIDSQVCDDASLKKS